VKGDFKIDTKGGVEDDESGPPASALSASYGARGAASPAAASPQRGVNAFQSTGKLW
jgi:hypothetical protein